MESNRRLLYFAPDNRGGLADYAYEQVKALRGSGLHLNLLTTPIKAARGSELLDDCLPILRESPDRASCPSKLARRVKTARAILRNIQILERVAKQGVYRHVMLGWYFEYLAPLWAPRLTRLARRGTKFGAVVHDPIRDFVVGPAFWHRWSTACGYSFLRDAFVHEPIDLPTVRPQPQLRTTVIPHGPYRFSTATTDRNSMRERVKVPPDAPLLLAFGHLRDAKNLGLVLEAMKQLPEFYLLVAGRELGAAQRPATYYQRRATELGVANRCRWDTRHIPEAEVGNIFEAADLVLLTYNAGFSSASGVLNAACHFRKPCLASSGKSNLRTVVERYTMGYWVEPDSVPAIINGLMRWLCERPAADWAGYEQENSWKRNAEIVLSRMFDN